MLIVANVNHNQPVGVARVNEGKMSALCFSFTEHSVVVTTTTTTTTSTTTSTTTRVKPLPNAIQFGNPQLGAVRDLLSQTPLVVYRLSKCQRL